MYDRTGNYLIVAIVIGLILGIVAPVLLGNGVLPVKFLGDIFLNALKLVAVPLVLCSIIMGIINLGALGKMGRAGLKTLAYFLATAAVAVVIGMVLANVLQPGIAAGGAGMPGPQVISYSFLDWLVAQFPSNVFAAMSEFRLLPVVFFAFLFGSVLALMGPKGKPVVVIIESLTEALMKMVRLIMWFAPLGVFGLVAGQIAAAGGLDRFWSELSAVGGFSLVVLIGLGLQAVIILPLVLKFFGGKNPVEFAGGMSSALLVALASASSAATLPVTMDCVESKNDIDKRASALVLPPGAALDFHATALFIGAAAVFILQAHGGDLTIWSQLVIFVTAVLASFAVAGIPQAGLLGLALVLQAGGMPMESIGLGLGLLLGVDWFLDRCRTVVNVWGNAIGAAVLASTEEIGLVDRRPRPPEKQQRFPRFKVPLRRQDFSGRKKEFDRPGRGGDRTPVMGKQPESAQAPTVGRRASDNRGREDRRGQRPPRPEHREHEYRGPERREEYRPTAGPTPEQGAEKRPERPERPDHGERRDRPDRSDRRQRQPFGRKSHRGDRPGPGGQRETDKDGSSAVSKETPKEVGESPVTEPKPIYEVPKFPEKILEELAAPATAEAAEEFVGDGTEQPETDRTAAPESNDFARLDRMVMGENDASEPTPRMTEERWEPTPEVPTTERISDDFSSEPEEPSAEDKPFDRGESTPAEPSSPASAETANDEEDTLPPGETAAAESGDDVEPVQWGRPKRKKLSR